ncbi:MAG: DNA replication and repair protein RecF [Candidatus Blackburnbacteria bacterium]|nr:DNA replication and repair protein RecF [Candidatus Blackburnbacteria bacterium]
MLLNALQLQNFRNLQEKNLIFNPNITIIVGPNGAGKTNILEAIYLLSSGKSFRADLEREMVRVRSDFARVKGKIDIYKEKLELEVLLAAEKDENIGISKKLLVNGVSRQLHNFAGSFKAVAFGPSDLELVTHTPGRRRKFLDSVISQVDREYRRSLLSYEKGLRQRNRILEQIREGEATRSQLLFWDKLVIKNGNYLSNARRNFIDFANETGPLGEELFSVEYDSSGISEERLAHYAREEVQAGATLVGPHRDDIVFRKHETETIRSLTTYGSRGEQRMSVLWLKLAELAFIEKETEQSPVLLLDDIFSELDPQHHEIVLGVVMGKQAITTTADPNFAERWHGEAQIVEL